MKSNFKLNNKSQLTFKLNNKAQLTVFIILAIVIVGGVFLFFILKGNLFKTKVPAEIEPVYSYYLSCVEEEALNGVDILEQQGGYIENPDFEKGNEYMPFSSQLNFLGVGVPYWYYISGNGIKKEQIPSREKMESQLNSFLKNRLNLCDFSEFEKKGFEISYGNVEINSFIKESFIEINIKQDLTIKHGETIWRKESHKLKLNKNLGGFYDLAKKIYENNKETMFLENYGVDILRLYAPVDGSEIGCASKIWSIDKIRRDLINALESNIPAVKIKGDYYKLLKSENKYFVKDIGEKADVNVNFMYSKNWPMKMEIWPNEGEVLQADPIGLQQGLGMLGFCYVPYHFVYDFAFPVLVQLYSGNEIFQFPVVVSIEKNKARKPLNVEGLPDVVPELCEHKNTELNVYTYNVNLEPVEADIKFKCFDTTCFIGKTESGKLTADFPQCENGFIIASSKGYENKKQLLSSIDKTSVDMILDKKYKLNLEITKKGKNIEYSVVTFLGKNKTVALAYPEQKQVELTEGQYEIKVYIYSNSSIKLKGEQTEKCVEIPKSGILGVFGLTKEKCITIQIPDQTVGFAVSGGGKQNYYIAESELKNSNKLIIDSNDFGIPKKIEDLQINYNNLETNGLDIRFE